MRRHGIVHVRPHAVVAKIGAECLAVLGAQNILVPHHAAVVGKKRLDNQGIVDFSLINGGYLAPACVLGVEVRQLHVEHRGLHGVEAAVVALVDVVVAAVAAVVGQSPYGGGELGVGATHGAGVAEGAEVFRGIKTECRGMPERAGGVRAARRRLGRHCADGLRVVFHQDKIVAANDICHRGVVGRAAVEVYREQGPCARANVFLQQTAVDIHRGLVGFDEHRTQTAVGHGEHGGYVGIGRHEHLVAFRKTSELYQGHQDRCSRPPHAGWRIFRP